MAFKDLDDFFDDSLALPVGSKLYKIPSPPAELGLWCQRVLGAGMEIAQGNDAPAQVPAMPTDLNDEEERDLYIRLLGPVWHELMADGVSWEKIKMIGQTAFIWVGGSRDLAEAFWNSGADPKALGPSNRAARRAASTSTAGARTTRVPGSTSGTKSRKSATGPSVSRRSPGKPS